MKNKAISVLMILVGLVNFAPLIGLLSVSQLNSMYGTNISDPNLQILMLHRALMFGLLGGLILYSAFHKKWQPLAMLLAFISMLGFILICWNQGAFNEQIQKVMFIDLGALVLLIFAMLLHFLGRKGT